MIIPKPWTFRFVTAIALNFLTAVGVAIGQPAQGCIDPPTGMVSWWPGDANADDMVDGNQAVMVGDASFDDGKVGQAFSVNGTAGSFVEVPDSANLNFGSTSPITVDLWAFRSGSAPVQHIMGKRNDCGFSGFDINYQMGFASPGGLFFGAHQGSVSTGTDLPLHTWTHLAATFDGTTFRFYVNGQLSGTGTGTLGLTFPVPLRIGTSGTCHNFGQGFEGLIDELEIFDRALSAFEIQAMFNAGAAGKCRDSDGDGVPDEGDSCPASIVTPTVVIAGCDSHVTNTTLPSGCTIADSIQSCIAAAQNHGQFVSCVAHLANELRQEGFLTAKSKAALQRCAGFASLP